MIDVCALGRERPGNVQASKKATRMDGFLLYPFGNFHMSLEISRHEIKFYG